MSETDAIRAAIRRLRQADIAGVIRASTERNATEVGRAWSELARYADIPRDELRARRWTSFTTEELHALARGFDVADHESLIDERGPDRELWRGVWDELDARGAWAGWQGADRP